jgi:hypothetical protein
MVRRGQPPRRRRMSVRYIKKQPDEISGFP